MAIKNNSTCVVSLTVSSAMVLSGFLTWAGLAGFKSSVANFSVDAADKKYKAKEGNPKEALKNISKNPEDFVLNYQYCSSYFDEYENTGLFAENEEQFKAEFDKLRQKQKDKDSFIYLFYDKEETNFLKEKISQKDENGPKVAHSEPESCPYVKGKVKELYYDKESDSIVLILKPYIENVMQCKS